MVAEDGAVGISALDENSRLLLVAREPLGQPRRFAPESFALMALDELQQKPAGLSIAQSYQKAGAQGSSRGL